MLGFVYVHFIVLICFVLHFTGNGVIDLSKDEREKSARLYWVINDLRSVVVELKRAFDTHVLDKQQYRNQVYLIKKLTSTLRNDSTFY